MMARSGDKSKQPPECEPRFIAWSDTNPQPRGATGEGYWTTCPNLHEDGGGMEGERYSCAALRALASIPPSEGMVTAGQAEAKDIDEPGEMPSETTCAAIWSAMLAKAVKEGE